MRVHEDSCPLSISGCFIVDEVVCFSFDTIKSLGREVQMIPTEGGTHTGFGHFHLLCALKLRSVMPVALLVHFVVEGCTI